MAPQANGEFVAHMEDVLEVYQRPYDPLRPQVCMDETSKQLVSEVIPPRAVQPGQAEQVDYEYERQGVANLFLWFEPLTGQRQIQVTDQRTKQDWAHLMKELVDVWFPLAVVIVLVLDNLNTHVMSALYETFPPDEARRIWEKLEIHYTPKHGSWLNMAEIELAVLTRQCLDRRMPSKAFLTQEIQAWVTYRNQHVVIANWRFTTEDARIKLKHLYPSFER